MKKMHEDAGLFLAVALTLLKLLIIDIDPPEWAVGFYQPIDESYYGYRALNLYEYGNAFPPQDKIRLYGTPIVTNTAVYMFINIFGDNYLGFRFGSLLFGLITVVFFYVVLKKVSSSRFIRLVLPIFFALNFNFSMACIFVEPTIGRMAMMMLSLYITSRLANSISTFRSIFVWGICSAILVIFTYPTNAFTLAGSLISFLVLAFWQTEGASAMQQIGKALSRGLTYSLGVLAGVGLFLAVTYAIGLDEISAFSQLNGVFSYRVGSSGALIWNNLVNIGWAHMFTFNPFLFVATATTCLMIWIRPLRHWTLELKVTYSFLIALLIQTAFINDYPQRKLIIALPLALIVVAGAIEQAQAAESIISNRRKVALKLLFFVTIVGVTVALLRIFIPDYRSMLTQLGFVCMYILVGVSLVRVVVNWRMLTPLAIAVTLVPEFSNSFRYFVTERTYFYRDALIKLREYDGHVFVGGFSLGFRPYNSIKPYLNFYGRVNDSTFWANSHALAESDTSKCYSIGYLSQEEDYRKIGFYPKELLLNDKQATDRAAIYIYEERK